jgi:hypothetical protein
MSILNLLGVDEVDFDGRAIDKAVDSIKGYASNTFDEEEIDQANDALSDIKSEADSIDQLENISNNVSCLRDEAESMFEKEVITLKYLESALGLMEGYENDHTEFGDLIYNIKDYIESAKDELTNGCGGSHHMIDKHILTNQDVSFDFIPTDFFYYYSPKAGDVYYKNDKWKINVSTYIGRYNGLKITPQFLSYNNCIYKNCYDKMIELGIDPKNVSELDLQLLKIVDNHNIPLYTLFYEHSKNNQ